MPYLSALTAKVNSFFLAFLSRLSKIATNIRLQRPQKCSSIMKLWYLEHLSLIRRQLWNYKFGVCNCVKKIPRAASNVGAVSTQVLAQPSHKHWNQRLPGSGLSSSTSKAFMLCYIHSSSSRLFMLLALKLEYLEKNFSNVSNFCTFLSKV